MKYLICGLGNIGAEYEYTRHNIGFRVLDELAKDGNVSFSDQRYGAVAELKVKNKKLILLKPSTYMNLMGSSLRYLLHKANIEQDNALIVADDIALPFRTLLCIL